MLLAQPGRVQTAPRRQFNGQRHRVHISGALVLLHDPWSILYRSITVCTIFADTHSA